MPSAGSSAPLIKGYLPVKLLLPNYLIDERERSTSDLVESFFFVKEHQQTVTQKPSSTDPKAANQPTLFVLNAPFIPGVSTKILLRSIFGRYAEVKRVTVVENPKSVSDTTSTIGQIRSSCPNFFNNTIQPEGKFAHVVFTNNKAIKKVLRCLRDSVTGKMKNSSSSEDKHEGITISTLEIQTLAAASRRVLKRQQKEEQGGYNVNSDDGDSDDESDDDQNDDKGSKRGILLLAERYRRSYESCCREALLQQCNAVMESFENEEETERRRREQLCNQQDDDGFTTVTYSSSNIGNVKRDLETGVGGHNRRKAHKRSRSKKKKIGSSQLDNFYRFQMKETRKKGLQDLRKKFEEDLAKVKKMKEEKQYRPF